MGVMGEWAGLWPTEHFTTTAIASRPRDNPAGTGTVHCHSHHPQDPYVSLTERLDCLAQPSGARTGGRGSLPAIWRMG